MRVYSCIKFTTTVESVDVVMKQYGLTTLSELGEKLGIYSVDRRLCDESEVLRRKYRRGFAPDLANELGRLFRSVKCYSNVGFWFYGDADGDVSQWLGSFAELDPYSDEYELLYPDARCYKSGPINAFRYILRDFPKNVNKQYLYEWAREHPLYGWAIYKLFGESCPKDNPLAYLYENDGAERTILLPDSRILDDIWQVRLKADALDGVPKDAWVCHIERLIASDKLGRVSDLVLVLEAPKRFFGYESSRVSLMGIGMIAVTLFVDRKWTSVPPVMYHKVFTVDEYTDVYEMYPSPCRELACRFVEEKTGIHFENFYRGKKGACKIEPKGYPHGVFPCVSVGCTSASDVIQSQAYIEHDIDAPSYISFVGDDTLGLSKADGGRLGTVMSFFEHGTIGFWKMPAKKYVTENGEHFDEDTELLSFLNENLRENVSLLAYSEEDAGRLSENYMNNCIGMATKLMIDHNPLMVLRNVPIFDLNHDSIYERYIYGKYYERKVEKWEPNDTAPVPLDSLKEIFVTLIAADDSLEKPEIFYVLSESDRWYEYSYCNCGEDELTPNAVKKMTVHGLADESVVLSSVTRIYLIAHHKRWDYTGAKGSRSYRLSAAAALVSQYAGVRTLLAERQKDGVTRGRALSMANDMRVVWRVLTEKHGEFVQRESQTSLRQG